MGTSNNHTVSVQKRKRKLVHGKQYKTKNAIAMPDAKTRL
jgi:hypothetical protein